MGTRIGREELANLKLELKKHDIDLCIIKNLMKINSLSDLMMDQYNYLLYLIKN